MNWLRRWLPRVTIALFSILILLSLSAELAGVDPDSRWGPLRQAVFVIGASGLLGAACLHLIRALDRRALPMSHEPERAETEVKSPPKQSGPKPSLVKPMPSPLAKPARQWIAPWAGLIAVLITGLTYVGLVSAWHWSEWPATTASYAALGDAFVHGKTYLAADSLPCDVNAPVYEGRCYLYWGPAPAVALAILTILGAPPLGDEVVVFAAVSLIFLFSTLIVFRLQNIYFVGLPLWLLIAGVATVGTIHPMLWFQNSPDVATAAIASGQAFLLGGTYFIVRVMSDAKAVRAHYTAAGALWAVAMTSRLTTAPQVIVLTLGAAIILFGRAGRLRAHRVFVANFVSLLAPLVLVLALYGWYNLARFDNPFETGWRYAPYNLTRFGTPSDTGWHSLFSAIESNAQMTRGAPFSLRYLIPNTLYHFLAPIRPIAAFPYFRALYGSYQPFSKLLPRLDVPAGYGVEDAAGLLFVAPTLLFALTFARKWLYGEIPRLFRNEAPLRRVARWNIVDLGPLGALLLLSGLAGLLPVFLNYFSTIRYEMDFIPSMALVAVLGMWRLYEDTRPFPIQSRLATTAIVVLVTAATLVSFLLALSGAGSRLDDANPGLFAFLVRFLPHW